jgi:hypothetical protein
MHVMPESRGCQTLSEPFLYSLSISIFHQTEYKKKKHVSMLLYVAVFFFFHGLVCKFILFLRIS